MRRSLNALAIGTATLALLACRGGGSTLDHKSGKTLATVNGTPITEGDLDFLGTINPRLKAQAATPFGQKQILDNLVEQELLYQESINRRLDHDAKVLARADLYRRVIVAQAAIDSALEEETKKYFDEHKGEFEKLEMAHILIRFKSSEPDAAKGAVKPKEPVTRTEEQALSIASGLKARLEKGEDFATLATEHSEDVGSKNAGGLLGKVWKQEPRLERRGYGPLLEQAFALKVGEVGGPIKTQEGYHLITVTKGVEAQSFEEAKQSILFKIQGDVRSKFTADLKAKAKIEFAAGTGGSPDEKPAEKSGESPTTTPAEQPATQPPRPATEQPKAAVPSAPPPPSPPPAK